MKLLSMKQLAATLGITVRRLEEDVREGMPVSKIGPRNARMFDPAVAKAWRRTNRRQVFGEGRGRSMGDLQVRAKRLLTGETTGPTPRTPPVEMADLDHTKILQMVIGGKLDQAHSRAYISAIEAMERGLEFRKKTAQLVEATDVERAVRGVAQAARMVLESGVDAMVAAVAQAVPLTESQRHAVRKAADENAKAVMKALAKLGGTE